MIEYDALDGESLNRSNYEDPELTRKRILNEKLMDKQNELLQVMNSVANKYVKWSLAKDHFISEVIGYSSQINESVFSGSLSLQEAIDSIEHEITSLRKQDEELSKNQIQQVVVVHPVIKEHSRGDNGKDVINVDLTIAGIGFVSGGLQIVAGVGMVGTGAGAVPGALLIAHGINNVIENGYYLLYRQSYTGPVRLVYQGVGELFGLDTKESDIIYTLVDVGLSLNGMLGYKLAEDAQRLYRYVNEDLLWGMKKLGITLMGPGDIILEIWGDANTLLGQWRSNQ